MKRYSSNARIDTDRFGYVRERERFLYENPHVTQSRHNYEHRSYFREFSTHVISAILIISAIILGIFLGSYYSKFHTSASLLEKTPITPKLEPEVAAMTPMRPSVSLCSNCDGASNKDIKIAKIAWKYFEKNLHKNTGLVNSVNDVETTTMWDIGSTIAAYVSARDFNLITQHTFDHSIMALLQTLANMALVENVAPNLLYNTRDAKMVEHNDSATRVGIGVSTIDLSRVAFWLNTLQCFHPKYFNPVQRVINRWNYEQLFKEGQIYGLIREPLESTSLTTVQQGRFGFEQYAGRIFKALGHPTDVSADYEYPYRSNTEILGVKIAHDIRDPRDTGVNNFVLTDPFTLDGLELGVRSDNKEILQNVYRVQKERWRRTGITTALTDGHINQAPFYLYNTIFDAGLSFTSTTDTGVRKDELRTISTRAAFMLAVLFPNDSYSSVLLSTVESAYDPEEGWFSGIYENGGFNDITTANTNGIILQTMLYNKYGPIAKHCQNTTEVTNGVSQ